MNILQCLISADIDSILAENVSQSAHSHTHTHTHSPGLISLSAYGSLVGREPIFVWLSGLWWRPDYSVAVLLYRSGLPAHCRHIPASPKAIARARTSTSLLQRRMNVRHGDVWKRFWNTDSGEKNSCCCVKVSEVTVSCERKTRFNHCIFLDDERLRSGSATWLDDILHLHLHWGHLADTFNYVWLYEGRGLVRRYIGERQRCMYAALKHCYLLGRRTLSCDRTTF